MMDEEAVIFFDGVCNLCNGAVQFTIQRDHHSLFRFSSLQSDFAKAKLKPLNIDPDQGDSFVLLENGKVYQRSTAALRVARRLNGFWPLLYGFIIVPRFLRDAIYNFVAKNRYKWFGKKETCWVPTPELRERFI
ncbi:MAG TPA: thiol-disulfide oxidoreductase DCC family protein [Pedobacter sp.]|nr:thiol-disulfide oxidoreductase DCC family protein [Pedobacter sp.]